MNRIPLALSCVALVGASTILAMPGAATAAKGGGSGGGTTSCAPIVALNSGTVDKPSSRKTVTPQVQVTNCGGADVTFTLRVVATRYTLRAYDPLVVETCSSAPYGGQAGTLRSGRGETYTAPATIPSCPSAYGTSPWGVDNTYSVDYSIEVVDSASGAVLGNAVVNIPHAGGA